MANLKSIAANAKVVHGGVKASLTSDGYTGSAFTFDGYDKVLAIVETATPSTSVATLTVSFQKAVAYNVATDNAATDWGAIASDCSIVAATYAASTNTYLGVLEITIPASDSSGCIRASVLTAGEGLTIDGLAITYILFGGSDIRPTTDYTPVYWPS